MAATSAAKAINTQDITDKARRDLLRLLEAVRGKKNLVIERSLAGTINLFVTFSTLQQYGVDKPFFLENHNIDSSQRNIIFLVRGENAKKIQTVAEQIRLVRSESKTDHDFTIIWVPRRTLVSNLILEEHGVLGEANITELDLSFIPLEADLLSLELEDAFSTMCLRKDPTSIFASARALMQLQQRYGLFPRILGKGHNAKRLVDLLQRMRNEEDVNASADPSNTYLASFGLTPSSLVENLIVIDREVDFATVLATQLTYEGLLEEVFGIVNNQTEVDSAILGGAPAPAQQPPQGTSPTPAATTKRKVQLDSSDKLYPSVRDANFATIGPLLNRTARRLQDDQKAIQNPDQSMSDLKNSVKSKLPVYQAEQASLKIHTSLAEELVKTTRSDLFRRTLEIEQTLFAGGDVSTPHENIEEMMARDVPLRRVLRLLCLESCITGGLRPRELESLKRQILHAYGYQHLLTLRNLEKMGLLVSRESHTRGGSYLQPLAGAAAGAAAGPASTDWSAVRRSLHLWNDEVQEADPTDVAYVFSGYAPLSVRLVQCALQQAPRPPPSAATPAPAAAAPTAPTPTSAAAATAGWKGAEDALARIRGPTVDVAQPGRDPAAAAARRTLRGPRDGPRVSLVFFLGGVTYAEVAALRLLSAQLQAASGRSLVVATTGLVSGKTVIDAAVETRGFGR